MDAIVVNQIIDEVSRGGWGYWITIIGDFVTPCIAIAAVCISLSALKISGRIARSDYRKQAFELFSEVILLSESTPQNECVWTDKDRDEILLFLNKVDILFGEKNAISRKFLKSDVECKGYDNVAEYYYSVFQPLDSEWGKNPPKNTIEAKRRIKLEISKRFKKALKQL